MPNGKSQVAQFIYLAQLHAAKSSCKCKVCELMRKTVDAMTEEILNPSKPNPGGIEDMIAQLTEQGYQVSIPMAKEETE